MPQRSHRPRKRSMTVPEDSAGAPGAPCSCSAAPSSWTPSTSRWSASRCRRSSSDLGLSTSSLQWVVSAYVLGYGGFLLLGGRAADLLGRRRGVPDFPWRVRGCLGARRVRRRRVAAHRHALHQGRGAAFTAPAGLSIITTTFAEGRGAQQGALDLHRDGRDGLLARARDRRAADRGGLALGVLPARPGRADRADRGLRLVPDSGAERAPPRVRRGRRGDDHGRDAAARLHARRGAERRLGVSAHARCRSRARRSC